MMSKLRVFAAVVGVVLVMVIAAQVAAQGARAAQNLAANTIEQVVNAVPTQEIVGVVDAMTVGTITIDGHVINILSANIKTALQVGELVKVHYVVASDGTWVAQDVESVLAGAIGCPEMTEAATSSPEATDSPEATATVPNCSDLGVGDNSVASETETPEPTEVYHSEQSSVSSPEPTEVHHSEQSSVSSPEPTEVHHSDQQQSDSSSGDSNQQDSEGD